MKKNIFVIFLIYCSLSFCQERNIIDPSDFANRLFPLKFISDTSFGLVINLRYFPSLTNDPQMIIIEYKNEKSFKVTYYWTTYSYICASYEERLKQPEFYRDFEEFTNKECPFFSNYIKEIYQIMLPKNLDPNRYIFTDPNMYDLLIDSDTGMIYIERVHIGEKAERKIENIFKKAWNCIQKKYKKKNLFFSKDD